MNTDTLLAVLELKGLISHEEALRLSEQLRERIAPSNYEAALAVVKPLLDLLG